MSRKKAIPIVIAALAAVTAVATRSKWSGDGPSDRLHISGNIEMTEVKVSFKISGRLVERAVNEGDTVTAGMVVARLDQEQLLHQKDQARAALAGAESQLAQLLTAIDFQRETLAAQTGQRQAEIRAAEAQLAELEAGSRRQEIEQARALLEEAKTEHQRAASDWERAQPLFKADDISRAQYDQFQARFESSRAQVRQAAQRLALIEEGPRKETIEAARARLEQARAAARVVDAQRLELKRREQEVDLRRAEIERAKAQLALIESQLNDTVALAPHSGVVLSEAAEVGEVIAAGTSVVTIGDLERPWLRGYINQTDLGRVRIGAPVSVTTDSFPGKTYQGRLSFLSSEAEFTPKQIQTEEERVKLVYRVKIDVDNPDQELKLNMPAEAEILTGQ